MDTDTLMSALWRDVERDKLLRVFSLQDAAASHRIHPNIVLSLTDNVCLYDGRIPKNLTEAAPHLVRLSASAAYTRWFLEEGWGNHWGLFFQSQANLMTLRDHFRRLLLVKDEAGRILSFRFYDPRVMRAYLPTCESNELRMVFGPVARFFVETENGSELFLFELEQGKLKTLRVPVNISTQKSPQPVLAGR